MNTITERILAFNKDRVPELVKLKYGFMSQDVFRFYRGTCHLFYEDLSKKINWEDKTKCWITGDLHLENFGTYKGDNRVVYFDMNDFDESLLAPSTWELSRLLTSIHLAAKVLDFSEDLADKLAADYTNTFINVLKSGKSLVVEKETAEGLLKQLIKQVQNRSQKEFVLSRVTLDGKKPKLLLNEKILKFKKGADRRKVIDTFQAWMDKRLGEKKYTILDVAYRIAGTGSVGVRRYVLLLHETETERLHLADLKEAKPSSLMPYSVYEQPVWKNEAERVVTLQKRVEHVSPAFLHPLIVGRTPFVAKELQPSQDRMDLALCKGKKGKLSGILCTMADANASGQLRSSGRQGSSTADELISFATSDKTWKNKVLSYSKQYAKQVVKDYAAYKVDYDAGLVK